MEPRKRGTFTRCNGGMAPRPRLHIGKGGALGRAGIGDGSVCVVYNRSTYEGAAMWDMVGALFDERFMPHGHCYFWRPEVLYLHVGSDMLIALSYYSIPVSLMLLVRRRPDLQFRWIFFLFSAFILACGTTHLFAVWTVWNADYGTEGLLKGLTGVISAVTAGMLWPAVPKLLEVPNPEELRLANARLHEEMEERRRAEERANELAENLELLVQSRTRALEASNRDLERFAHVASHDLREPMRTTLAFAERLQQHTEGALDEQGQRYLQFIVDGSERMHELTSYLLKYARVGACSLEPRQVDLGELLDEAAASLDAVIENSGGSFTRGPMPTLEVDPHLLRAALQNVMENGFKYVGTIPPEVVATAVEHEDRWEIRIVDNGPGFPEGQETILFEPFRRLHHRVDIPGSGMGLAIAASALTRHGGSIAASSELGVGSTFIITLPKHGAAA